MVLLQTTATGANSGCRFRTIALSILSPFCSSLWQATTSTLPHHMLALVIFRPTNIIGPIYFDKRVRLEFSKIHTSQNL